MSKIFCQFSSPFLGAPLVAGIVFSALYCRAVIALSIGTGWISIHQIVEEKKGKLVKYDEIRYKNRKQNSESILGAPLWSGIVFSALYCRAVIGLSIGTGWKQICQPVGEKKGKFGQIGQNFPSV